jgi:octopine/nopaline transport system permease protein
VAGQVIAHSYRTLDVFCLAAVVYLGLTGALTAALRSLERRLNPVEGTR